MTRQVRDPNYESRVRGSFAKQEFMTTLGVRIESITPGEVVLSFPFRQDLTQQHGFVHAGVVTSVIDSACGYAALTLMEPGVAVLSVEFKVNLLAPAAGREFIATGRVLRAGRTLTVIAGEVRTSAADGDTLIAVMQGTMMTVRDRTGLRD